MWPISNDRFYQPLIAAGTLWTATRISTRPPCKTERNNPHSISQPLPTTTTKTYFLAISGWFDIAENSTVFKIIFRETLGNLIKRF
jgi:hypothetical protein